MRSHLLTFTWLPNSNICLCPSQHPTLTAPIPTLTSFQEWTPHSRFGFIFWWLIAIFPLNAVIDMIAGQLRSIFATWSQVLLQLPSYLRNSGQSFIHQGSLVTPKEQQPGHMHWAGPIASAQFKPTGNSKGVAQFPTWQNGRIEPPTLVPFAAIIHPPSSTEVLGAKHCQLMSQQQYHNQQQQQQHFSLQSSFFRATGKSLDNLPHPVLEETLPRFHGGGALSLQLLCSERQWG